jgi:hypothetical protein
MPIPANPASCRANITYFLYIQSNYASQMQTKRGKSQLLLARGWEASDMSFDQRDNLAYENCATIPELAPTRNPELPAL